MKIMALLVLNGRSGIILNKKNKNRDKLCFTDKILFQISKYFVRLSEVYIEGTWYHNLKKYKVSKLLFLLRISHIEFCFTM